VSLREILAQEGLKAASISSPAGYRAAIDSADAGYAADLARAEVLEESARQLRSDAHSKSMAARDQAKADLLRSLQAALASSIPASWQARRSEAFRSKFGEHLVARAKLPGGVLRVILPLGNSKVPFGQVFVDMKGPGVSKSDRFPWTDLRRLAQQVSAFV
jgi:hypothetical protein